MYQARCRGRGRPRRSSSTASCTSTQRPNDVVALDAKTGRVFWIYRHVPAADHKACCGANNRGLAILGDTLFMGTLDARLVAIDAKTGRRCGTCRSPSTSSVLDDARAARRQGQGDRRRRRRRSRHSRLHRRVRRARPARRCGASTRFPARASPATKRGKPVRRSSQSLTSPRTAIPRRGSMAAARSGSPARTIPIST